MENIAFVIWLLFFPVSYALEIYLWSLAMQKKKEKEITPGLAMCFLVIYLYVAYLLYKK